MTDTNIKIHFIFATLIAHIDQDEMNATTNKVRKSYRMWLKKYSRSEKYKNLAIQTQQEWEKMSKELEDNHKLISLPTTLLELVDMLSDKKSELVVSKKLMERLVVSQTDINLLTLEVEAGAMAISDLLRENFGVKKRVDLSFIKTMRKTAEFNRILEGKAK